MAYDLGIQNELQAVWSGQYLHKFTLLHMYVYCLEIYFVQSAKYVVCRYLLSCMELWYRTRTIITLSSLETALDYKQRILRCRKVSCSIKPLCSINRGLFFTFR